MNNVLVCILLILSLNYSIFKCEKLNSLKLDVNSRNELTRLMNFANNNKKGKLMQDSLISTEQNAVS
jgi:hypothetical protein